MKPILIVLIVLLSSSMLMADNNVVIKFNNGRDTIFTGITNTMEIWIANDIELWSLSLGFELGGYDGKVYWKRSYGNTPPVNREGDAGDAFAFFFNSFGINDLVLLDSIVIAGVHIPGFENPLPPNNLRKCYTMQFKIHEGEPEGSLYIDNIWLPPAADWLFGFGTGAPIAPDYFGCDNESIQNPDCPPEYFPVLNAPEFLCGDVDNSGAVDPVDLVQLINILYKHFPVVENFPPERGDIDCSGRIDLLDIIHFIRYFYEGIPLPCNNCP